MIDAIIVITGIVAIYLTQQSNDRIKKYACLFGLAGQPLWVYKAHMADERGILIMACAYTLVWFIGLHQEWYKPWKLSRVYIYGRVISKQDNRNDIARKHRMTGDVQFISSCNVDVNREPVWLSYDHSWRQYFKTSDQVISDEVSQRIDELIQKNKGEK